jgi:hypothetical protein
MKVDGRASNGEPRVSEEARQQRLLPAGWEYRSALLDRAADLSHFGAEGWECFSVIAAAGDQAMFYFRRRC